MKLFSPRTWAVIALSVAGFSQLWAEDRPSVEGLYQNYCASCHGANFEGGQGPNLIDLEWKHGSSDAEIAHSIAQGYVEMAMPGWDKVLQPDQIRSLVIFLQEKGREAQGKANPLPGVKIGEPVAPKLQKYKIVTEGLKAPWSLAFLPDGRRLVSEKSGSLRVIDAEGHLLPEPIRGTPAVMDFGQGGLLGVTPHPDYAKNGWIYLAFSDGWRGEKDQVKANTAIGRGRIKDGAWIDQEWIWRADTRFYTGAGIHFGSRIILDKGYVWFIVGERGGNMEAQDLTRPNGKIFRLFEDGRIPPDNPFVSVAGAEPGIWSYGHRNPQGFTLDSRDGEIYETEHGPRGGDEFNHIVKGGNFGWPVITYGMGYDGKPITALTEKEGMEQPITHWTPSIATCGLAIYMGDQFPQWKNDFFAGSLKAQELHRLRIAEGKLVEDEIVLKDAGRIRDVQSGPDGFIYLVLNGPDRIVRLEPAE